VSVAGCVARRWVGFSPVESKPGRVGVGLVDTRARQGCRWAGSTMPCRCVWGVGLGEAQVHRNMVPALGALGGLMA
jgi:hypothetical protein